MNISVLVTVYNLRHLAPRAIESVLAQTRSPIEIVVVDDGSRDGSADALESAFGKRIRLVRLVRNEGVLRATLEGLRRLSGEIVCFLDGDDIWEREKLRLVAQSFERDASVIMVSHDYRMVASDERVLRDDDPLLAPTASLARGGDARALSDFMRASVVGYGGHVWLGSAYAIRRSALNLEAFSSWVEALPEARFVYQDHPLSTFLLVHAEGRVDYVDEKLLRYRVHDANYSSAAIDLERAQNIVRKGLATRRATYAIVAAGGPAFEEATAIQAAKIREYEFLMALYARNYRIALREFGACVRRVWSARQTLKELARLAAVLSVGPARFLTFKHRYLDAAKRA